MTKLRHWRTALAPLAAVLSLLLIWQAGAWSLPEYLLPGPLKTWDRLIADVTSSESFQKGLYGSLLRIGVGYPLACLLGTILGLLAGISVTFRAYLRGVITILQAVPPITWVPFLVILMGFGNKPIIIMILVASFFPMALSVMNATEGVSKTHLELARVMGAGRLQTMWKVYLPETLPAFVTGAQMAFGNAWRSLIAAEMVGGARDGLGSSIRYAGDIADMKGVLVGIVVIGALAILFDRVLLETAKRRLLRYRYVGAGEGNE